MKRRRISFTVTLDLPKEASVGAARRYILDAVQTMRGSLQPPGYCLPEEYDQDAPGDPMWHLVPETITVSRQMPKRKNLK